MKYNMGDRIRFVDKFGLESMGIIAEFPVYMVYHYTDNGVAMMVRHYGINVFYKKGRQEWVIFIDVCQILEIMKGKLK